MHLDEETLERALHHELDSRSRNRVERHLAACPECAERLAEARRSERLLHGLLEEVDREPPPLDWDVVTRGARGGETRRSLLAAGLAFLLLTAGLLYAIPGSPVRGWIHAALGDDPLPTTTAPRPRDTSRSGIAVVPTDPFEVRFVAPQSAGTIRIVLVPSSRLELIVAGEPVELESDADRLVVSNRGSNASYELSVPRTLGSIRIRVVSRTIFEKLGETVRAVGVREEDGAYLVTLRDEEG